MEHVRTYQAKSIRTFVGAKNYAESRQFYRELGFEEIEIGDNMCLFKVNDSLSFYLQDYYVRKWCDNSMVFLEVDDIEACWRELNDRGLHNTYKNVKLTEIKDFDWGRECFMHDPSGVLWHFGQFK